MEHQTTVRAIPAKEWNEEVGPALWWSFPIKEPPYVGTPLDDDFSANHYTHYTSIPLPSGPRDGDGLTSQFKETGRFSSLTPHQANVSKKREPDQPPAGRYDALVAKHGTYRQFEDAVWNAVGEVSVDEARLACAKYKQDLADAIKLDLAERGIEIEVMVSFVDTRDRR